IRWELARMPPRKTKEKQQSVDRRCSTVDGRSTTCLAEARAASEGGSWLGSELHHRLHDLLLAGSAHDLQRVVDDGLRHAVHAVAPDEIGILRGIDGGRRDLGTLDGQSIGEIHHLRAERAAW